MKNKLSKALVLLLTVAIVAAQLMVPAYAVEPYECTCDINTRTGTFIDTVAATCEDYAYDVYECDECYGQYTVAIALPLGHTPGSMVTENYADPTCTEKGGYDEVVYCIVCGKELSHDHFDIDELGHTPGSKVTENYADATCSADGGYDEVVYCTVCNEKLSSDHTVLTKLPHTWGAKAVARQPKTCLVDGWKAYYECTVCGAKDANKNTPELDDPYAGQSAPGHKFPKNPTNVVAPTCTTGGYDEYVCTNSFCDKDGTHIEKRNEVNSLGHTPGTPVVENNIGATCTVAGSYDEVVYCTVCGVELSRTPMVNKELGHKPGSVEVENVVAETCTTDGSYDNVVYCTVCGDELSRETIPVDAFGHDYKAVVTNPTHCQATDGYTTYTCSICSAGYVVAIKPMQHDYEIIDITGETCTNPGTVTYKCKVSWCGMELVETVAEALPHTEGSVEVENKVDPDCYTDGSYDNVVYCTVCNTELSRKTEVVPSKGHNLTDVPKLDATCTADGYEAHELCTICGYETPFAIIPATGHNYEAKVIAPTCTKQGYTVNTCSVCGDAYKDAYTAIDSLNHTTYISKFSVAATCTETGLTHEIGCTECNEVIKTQAVTPINPSNHNVVSVVTDPTCTEDGYTTHSCSRDCGYFTTYKDTVVPALGHRMENVVALAATCTTPGYTAHQECNRCGFETPYLVIDAFGHDYDSVVTDPTCTEDGYTTHTCNRCKDVVVDSIVTELGHVTTVTIGKVDPTCTEYGYTIEKCVVCEETFRDNFVDALGHTESDFIKENNVDPTCTTEGSYDTVVYCTVCVDENGDPTELSRKTTVVPALGHTEAAATQENRVEATCTVDGHYDSVVYCSVCGEELSRETITLTAPGHTEAAATQENRVEPTCTVDGKYDSVVYCSVCGEELSRETITLTAPGHVEDIAVVENYVDSTCTAEGSFDNVVYCSVCKEELDRETIVIAKKPHTPAAAVVENHVDSTCTAEGSYDNVVYCSVCNTELDRETVVIPMKDHVEGNPVRENEIDSTCTSMGSYELATYCTGCDMEMSRSVRSIPEKDHTAGATVVENNVDPTCTATGSYDNVVYCSICNTELDRETITVPALGHTAGQEEIENVVDPTYDAEGSYDVVVYCSVCDVELSRETKSIAILNEKVSFSYEAVGINGADVAVNSGKITLNVYMNVESEIARLYGIDLGIKFNSGLSLDEVVFSADGFEAAAYGLSGVGIKLTQDMAASGDKTFEKGKHLIATLTFDVSSSFYNENAAFEIVTEDCEFARGMDRTYDNEITVDFGTGASIYVDRLGDFNNDGKYTVNDTMALSQWLDTSVDYNAVLDMDKDGSITANDLALIREAVAGNATYLF